MLGFEAEGAVAFVDGAVFAALRGGIIAGVELESGLCGKALYDPSRGRLVDLDAWPQFTAFPVDDKTVIVAPGLGQGGYILADGLAA